MQQVAANTTNGKGDGVLLHELTLCVQIARIHPTERKGDPVPIRIDSGVDFARDAMVVLVV